MTDPSRPRAILAWLVAFACWAAAVWWVSSRTDPRSDLHWPWEVPDKVAHGAVFAVGGFVARGAFGRARPSRAASASVVSCALWGAIDEIHQGFVPGRMTDPLDLVADVTGAAAGVAFHALLAREAGAPARDAL